MTGLFSRCRRATIAPFIVALAMALRSVAALPDPSLSFFRPSSEGTNGSIEMPKILAGAGPGAISNAPPLNVADFFAATNVSLETLTGPELQAHLRQRLELARYFRTTRQTEHATPILVALLD